jgi:hypothetical protein
VTAGFAGVTSLGGSIGLKSGPANARVWPIVVGNNGPAVASGAQITSFSLVQTDGGACTPVVLSVFPLSVGDIAAGATATGNVSIDFSSCVPAAMFKVTVMLSANSGVATGSIVRSSQLR